jgi:hypothetical protein
MTHRGARLWAYLVVATAAAAIALIGIRVPAAGAAELPVAGTFTATGTLGTSGCPTFHQVVDGSGEWTSLGTTSLHLDFCTTSVGALDWPAVGTFELTTATGTLTGDLGGSVQAGNQTPDGFPFTIDLTIAGGTGELTGATGTLTLTGFFGLAAATADGTVSGTVTTPTTPAALDDCRSGGWSDLVDDRGQPFRNQGECIAWVVRAR